VMIMNESALLKIISRMIFPFVVLFGLYIIFNGDLSPGGVFRVVSYWHLVIYYFTS